MSIEIRNATRNERPANAAAVGRSGSDVPTSGLLGLSGSEDK